MEINNITLIKNRECIACANRELSINSPVCTECINSRYKIHFSVAKGDCLTCKHIRVKNNVEPCLSCGATRPNWEEANEQQSNTNS